MQEIGDQFDLDSVFQIHAFSSLWDWRESAIHRFDWLRALSWEHQFENRYQVVFFQDRYLQYFKGGKSM